MATNGSLRVHTPVDYGQGFALASVTADGVFGAPEITSLMAMTAEVFGPRVTDFANEGDTLFVATGFPREFSLCRSRLSRARSQRPPATSRIEPVE
jgi:hypothetical protein